MNKEKMEQKIHNKINEKTYEETTNEKIIKWLETSYSAVENYMRRINANILLT